MTHPFPERAAEALEQPAGQLALLTAYDRLASRDLRAKAGQDGLP